MSQSRLPFHESIVETLRLNPGIREMRILATLIKMTRIPKGHDEIITAWNKRSLELGYNNYLDVPADLLEQRHEAEKEDEEKAAAKEKKAEVATA